MKEIKKVVERYFLTKRMPLTCKGYHNAVECITNYIIAKQINNDIIPATELYDKIEQKSRLEKGVVNKRLLDLIKQSWELFPEYFTNRPTPYYFIAKIANELDAQIDIPYAV